MILVQSTSEACTCHGLGRARCHPVTSPAMAPTQLSHICEADEANVFDGVLAALSLHSPPIIKWLGQVRLLIMSWNALQLPL